MAKKIVKNIYRFFEFVLGFIIILMLLLFIRLSRGPIDVKNLSSFILDNSLIEENEIRVDMKNAVLELALSRGRLMEVRIDELNVVDKNGFALTIEKTNLSFNPFWLLFGRFVPRDIELQKPYIQLNLANSRQEKQDKDERPICRKINRIRRYLEKLDNLKVEQGELTLNLEKETSILLPNLNLSLTRKEDDKMDFLSEGLFYLDNTFIQLKITALYDLDSKILTFDGTFNDIDLSKMRSIIPDLAGIDFLSDINAKGQLDLSCLKQGGYDTFGPISFEAKIKKEGFLQLPEPLNTKYQIQDATISGQITSKLEQINLTNSTVKILDKILLVNAQILGLKDFFDTKDFSKILISLNASLDDIPLLKVPDLWPSYLGTDAHQWIKENVTAGIIKKATLLMDMAGTEVSKLTSILDIQNATVRYEDEMAPVKNAQAIVTLETDKAKIDVISGQIDNIQVTGGYVNFLDLDKDVPLFDMDVQFEGSIPDALALVSTEPLLLCNDMPIPCKGIAGLGTGHVQMNFPFADEISDDLIKYNVSADLENVSLPVPKTEWNVSEGSFKLSVNNSRLTLQGRGLLDEKPLQLDITNIFNEKENSVYHIRLPITASMIVPYFNRIDNFLKGSLFTDINIHPLTDKEMSVGLEFGLQDAEISLPIGYVKEFKKRGTLKATLSIINEELASIPSIYLSMPDEELLIKGKVDLPKDKVFELNLSEIKAPRTDASIILSYFKNDDFDVNVKGKSLDVSDLLHGDFFARRADEPKQQEKIQDFSIKASLEKIYLSENEPFTDVSVNVKKQKGHWQEIKGSLVGNTPLNVSLNAEKTALNIQTQDVGDILKRAGYTDRIKGGLLDSTLSQEKDGTLSGTVKIKHYELTDTDFFIQAATLLGIVDAIQGNNIKFEKAIIPFKLSPTHQIKIDGAVAFGTAVGITMSGEIDSEEINLSGSVAPAYALNSLPGKIPVVGSILSGEEGGGLFGVSYTITGKTSKPVTSFNPASLLTPGIFRRIFDIF